jgi:hypothetical protein
VALLIVAIDPEVRFQGLVSMLGLTITLGVVKCNFILRALLLGVIHKLAICV